MPAVEAPSTSVPRVRITYEVNTGDRLEIRELPFVIGILSDLQGAIEHPVRLREKRFVEVSRDNLDHVMSHMEPHLRFKVALRIGDDDDVNLGVELRFHSVRDFEPFEVAQQVPVLKRLLEVRAHLHNLLTAVHANPRIGQELQKALNSDRRLAQEAPEEMLDRLSRAGLFGFAEEHASAGTLWLQTFFETLTAGSVDITDGIEAALSLRIAELDRLSSIQLSEILHHPEFQKLEASWRGLASVVAALEPTSMLKVRVLSASKRELLRDIDSAADFETSNLFRKIHDEEYGVFGGQPFATLIGDYEFDRTANEVHLLEQLAAVAAAVHAPFIAAASPGLFGFESFTQLPAPRDLARLFDMDTAMAWNQFRRAPQAAYAGLVLPHVLMRLPYGRANRSITEFELEEGVDGSDHTKYLWGNAAYTFAARLASSFSRFGRPAAIVGPESGGSVIRLPVHFIQAEQGDILVKCPTEVAISDRRRQELEQLGFIPQCWRKGSGEATFFHAHSLAKPVYSDDLQFLAAKAHARLEHMLAACRFAHYIRCIVRDKLGSYATPAELEMYLNDWLAGYVLLHESACEEVKARFPLRTGRISLREATGYPLHYIADLTIEPQFQIKEPDAPVHISVPVSLDFL